MSSLYRKTAKWIMALLMIMMVCWLVYAAIEYRIRKALSDHEAMFPNQKGKRIQHPTAWWVLHYFVRIHWLCPIGQWPIVLNLTEEHANLLRLLDQLYIRFMTSDIRENHEGYAECQHQDSIIVTYVVQDYGAEVSPHDLA